MNQIPSPVQRVEASPEDHFSVTEVGLTVRDLLDTGVLWLVNTAALHPRGLALAIDLNSDRFPFRLMATDGAEPVLFADEGVVNQRFSDFEEIVKALRDKAAWLKADG